MMCQGVAYVCIAGDFDRLFVAFALVSWPFPAARSLGGHPLCPPARLRAPLAYFIQSPPRSNRVLPRSHRPGAYASSPALPVQGSCLCVCVLHRIQKSLSLASGTRAVWYFDPDCAST